MTAGLPHRGDVVEPGHLNATGARERVAGLASLAEASSKRPKRCVVGTWILAGSENKQFSN